MNRGVLRIIVGAAAATLAAAAFANSDVAKLTGDPNNWAMQAGDFYNQRHSKLTQINTWMPGYWEVTITADAGGAHDTVVFKFCIQA